MRRVPANEPPTVEAVQQLCQRARCAGSPNGAPRGPLVGEYRRLAEALNVEPVSLATGRDLQQAAVGLLRAAADAEAAAAQTPAARLRRAGLHHRR
ncbi:MAG TPA: hypothetical protein PKE32_07905 [Miltoncostaeaceae bacterium]|nr:hypothetical protein [Miltoncostaeaceae bacterium]